MAEKKSRAPWEVTGSKIEGYWTYWPFHGAEFARRFDNEETARRYIPVKKHNKGRKLPLGKRVIYRVAWARPTKLNNRPGWWSFDPVEELSQDEVDDLFMKMAAEVAA